MSFRRVRATIRCLQEDLGIRLPGADTDLGQLNHPLVEECRRLAEVAPQGQKRILSIDFPLVFRVSHGRWRGASWVDAEHELFWLLAAEQREEGSHDDAYVHFESLHEANKLLPTRDDYLRDRVEEGTRALAAVRAELPEVFALARERLGVDHTVLLLEFVEVVVHVQIHGGIEMIWMAVSALDTDRNVVNVRLRDLIFGVAEQVLENAEWDWTAEWPLERDLKWFEVARLALQEAP